ncbi:MAG: ribonuclease III [Nitriliruptoraceae bacterium]
MTAIDPAPARSAHALAEVLGVQINDMALLDVALTHRSWAFEHGLAFNNERLEFLGDAVLGLVVTDEIYHRHHDEAEGRLAKLRAAGVKSASLAQIARELGLGDFLKLGRGEAASGGANKNSILADGLEAVFGAIYLDRGLDVIRDVILSLMAPRLERLAGVGAALDFKTSLQELVAQRFSTVPRYHVTDAGPDHAKTFTATVSVDGTARGVGVGPSKKQAEQQAAEKAWRALTIDDGPPSA